MAGQTDMANSKCTHSMELDSTVAIHTSIKQQNRKIKPIPPPLDLSKRGSSDETSSDVYSDLSAEFSASPKSPLSGTSQKHLPFRKRYVW